MYTQDFGKLEPDERKSFIENGGELTSERALANVALHPPAPTRKMSLANFRTLDPEARAKFCREGGKLID